MSAFKLGNWGTIIIAIITFFVGQLLPQFWKWKESRLGEEKLQLEHLKQTIDLRDKIEDKLAKLVMLAGVIREEKDKTRKIEMTMQFDIIKDDLISNENKLADLEKRKSRDIFKGLVPPPPSGIRLSKE